MSQAVGVLIVDELEGLEPTFRAVLEHHPVLQTVSEADLAQAEPAGAPARSVALVFVGADRSETGAVRIRQLKERRASLLVLVAFEVLSAEALCRLVDAGADAFVARSAQARDVCTSILGLAGVETAAMAGAEAPDATVKAGDGSDGLTPREAEILRFLSAGFSNKEVARRLNLSVRTVETHRLNLRRKTQTGRLKDLVALARHLGLAPVVEAEPRRSSGDASRPDRPRIIEAAARH